MYLIGTLEGRRMEIANGITLSLSVDEQGRSVVHGELDTALIERVPGEGLVDTGNRWGANRYGRLVAQQTFSATQVR